LAPAQQAKTFADLVSHRLDAAATETQLRERQRIRREAERPVQWLALGVDTPAASVTAAGQRAHVVDPARVASEAATLARLRAAAAARAACTVSAPVTSLVGDDGGGWAGHRDDDENGELLRESALAVGSVVHRILESLDLGQELPSQLRDAGARSMHALAAAVAPARLAETRSRLAAVLAVVESGGCLRRLAELADRVVARELPLLMPPAPGDAVLGAVAGSADLVYVEGDGLVVVDFKTDELASEDAIAGRVAHYRPQLERYAAALRSALALDQPPVMELWFLTADRIVRL
jgi:ATP-dependent exoDNAse (exonuclease V) beta subunit